MAGREVAHGLDGVTSHCRSEDSTDCFDKASECACDRAEEPSIGDDDSISSAINHAIDTSISPSSCASLPSERTSSMFVEVSGADNSQRFVCVESGWRGERGSLGGRRRCQSQRERSRHDTENAAFAELRRVIPIHPPDRKLSKPDILRRAIRYVQLLSDVLRYLKRDVATRCHSVVPPVVSLSSCGAD